MTCGVLVPGHRPSGALCRKGISYRGITNASHWHAGSLATVTATQAGPGQPWRKGPTSPENVHRATASDGATDSWPPSKRDKVQTNEGITANRTSYATGPMESPAMGKTVMATVVGVRQSPIGRHRPSLDAQVLPIEPEEQHEPN